MRTFLKLKQYPQLVNWVVVVVSRVTSEILGVFIYKLNERGREMGVIEIVLVRNKLSKILERERKREIR